MISRRVKEAIIHSAKELNQYNFVFKYELQPEDGAMFSNVTNLYLANWVPQKDLLCEFAFVLKKVSSLVIPCQSKNTTRN